MRTDAMLKHCIGTSQFIVKKERLMSDSILIPVRPCIKCGSCQRDKRGQCKACLKVTSSAWRAANPDRVRATYVAWLDANKEKVDAKQAVWRTKNIDEHKRACVAWRAANKDIVKVKNAAWYASNSDTAKASSAAWAAQNPERVQKKNSEWAAANPDRKKKSYANWISANQGMVRIYNQNRRSRKIASGGTLSKGLAEKLFALQKGKCPCCKQPLGDRYHLDHIVPLALGGPNTDDNIQLLRQRCNNQKHAKHPVDFMQQRGFLL